MLLEKEVTYSRSHVKRRVEETEKLSEQGALERGMNLQIQGSSLQGCARAGPGSARAGCARVFDVKEVFLAVSSVVT